MDRRKHLSSSNILGFTLIEMLCVMIILGILGVVSLRMFTSVVQGYTMARNSDAAVQKAQNALQRMTIDFTYLKIGEWSGGVDNITYNTTLDVGRTITINQEGNDILYCFDGAKYVLTDGVLAGSLQFNYYHVYDGASTSMSNSTNLIGITFTMVGDDPTQGFSKTFSTRVAQKKF